MCGVVVIAASNDAVDTILLDQMRDALAHRGPDMATSVVVDSWIGLGHRRLSIIDLEGAAQPLASEDGRVLCVFNGEIYNFQELRSRLRSLGHTFATAGDGEVIVHGYEQWGDDIFAKLEGMFVLALVDRTRERLVLARDRLGIKPLVYRWDGRTLFAASELKALLADPACSRKASRPAMTLGAARMHVPWPYTGFDGVWRVPPGALVSLQRGGKPELRRFALMAPASEQTVARPEEVLERLRSAVRRQLVADVPVGAFLSGGIDSTLIVALMRELTNDEVHTFSIETVDHDESGEAARSARELGTTHHTVRLSEISFDDLLALPALFDEPFAETSALGVRALSRFARQYVKVALSGDGGDEVFGGYGSYRWIRSARRVPIPRRGSLARIAHTSLQRRRWPPAVRRVLRAVLLAADDSAAAQRDVSTLLWASDAEARAESEALSAQIEAACSSSSGEQPFRRAMIADRLERLPNAMLTKVDIASMSESLEVRVPMLDDELVRFADGISAGKLATMRWGKVLLREALTKMPARRVAWAKKRGFTLPLDRWMASAPIATRLTMLFGDHERTLTRLTGQPIRPLWQAFLDGTSRFSQGTGAMQLLWFASVAAWADRFGVAELGETTAPLA